MHKPLHDDFSSNKEEYLYVRVVKARGLLEEDVSGRYVEVRLGNYKESTRHVMTLSKTNQYPEWNQVFAFLMDKVEATMLEVTVKDKNMKDDFMGWVLFDHSRIPKSVQPESPLPPQWYRLRDRKGDVLKGELMFSVWWGTHADEAFPEAIFGVAINNSASNHSKVYRSPRLWYLRVNVIEAHDVIPTDQNKFPEAFVKVALGHQVLRTRVSTSKSTDPMWNEDLMFVAAEPFVESVAFSVENRDESLGWCVIPLQYVERRFDNRAIRSRWFNLEKHVVTEGEKTKQAKFASRIHMRICLEGGYHVLDESTHYVSDYTPVAKQLRKPSIGTLELGILSAHGLLPMKTKDGRAQQMDIV